MERKRPRRVGFRYDADGTEHEIESEIEKPWNQCD